MQIMPLKIYAKKKKKANKKPVWQFFKEKKQEFRCRLCHAMQIYKVGEPWI